jgi:hypothetical protein
MQAVLDMPVAPHGVREQLGIQRQGGEVVALFKADAGVPLSLGLHGTVLLCGFMGQALC